MRVIHQCGSSVDFFFTVCNNRLVQVNGYVGKQLEIMVVISVFLACVGTLSNYG